MKKQKKSITEALEEQKKSAPAQIIDEEPVEKTLLNLKALLEVEEDYIVNLYKEDPRTKKMDFVDQILEIDARLMKNIKDQYGPGKYMIRVLDQTGDFVAQGGRSVFSISGSAAPVQAAAPVQEKISSEDQELKMLERMAKYKALFGGPADTNSILVEQIKSIMDLNRSMMQQSKTMLEDQIRLMNEAKGDGETNLYDVITQGIDQLPLVLAAMKGPAATDQAAIQEIAAAPAPAAADPEDPVKKAARLDNAKKIYYTMQKKVATTMFKDILINLVSKSSISADDVELVRNLLNTYMPEALTMIQSKTKDQVAALLGGAFGVSWTTNQRTNLNSLIDGLFPPVPDPVP
jgi:hypothetical protein